MADLLESLRSALVDRYQIDRELGHGGMARVFLAQDLKHHRPVAIKVLRPEVAQALGPERFLREIEIAARLTHPHILPLHESGEAAGFLYYVMPYVAGESLRDRITRERQLPLADALQIAREVADALGAAHRTGVVHRDIKPENILLANGHALVADFGIARALDAAGGERLTETGLAVGTPAYMSPEQASGEPLDGRADLYSLGCVLYEMLAGAPPFTGPSGQAILARHSVDPVPPLRTVRASVPEGIEWAIEKALAKVPADRFATVSEFIDELAAPGVRRPRARRSVILSAAAVVLVVGIGATALVERHRPKIAASAAVIAVLPFRPVVPDTALTRLGRDLAATVSANLDGVGELRTVDRLTILGQAQEYTRALSLEAGAALSRRYGATSVVYGSLARDGPRVRLDVGLYTSDGVTPLGRAVVTGLPDSLSALTDSLTWKLLAAVWRTGEPPTPTLQSVTTRSVEALRAYLEGERALVEGRTNDAAADYRRAVDADSTFWFAYFRQANAAGWLEGDLDPRVEAAYRSHISAFPRRERLLIAATAETLWTEKRVVLRTLVEDYPDYWPGWFLYADALVHYYPYLGSTRAEAREALERTVALNPRLVYGWGHLAWMTLADWDTARSAAVLEILDRLGARSTFANTEHTDEMLSWRTTLALQAGNPRARPLLDSMYHDALASPSVPWNYPLAFVFFGLPAAQVEFNRQLLRHGVSPESKSELLENIALSWVARGAWDSALVTLDARARGLPVDSSSAPLESYRLAVVGAWLGTVAPAETERRRSAAARGIVRLGPAYAAELGWVDGMLAVARRDREALAAARTAVRHSGSADTTELDRSLAAFERALAGDRAGAGRALADLEWRRANRGFAGISWGFTSHPVLRGVNHLAAAQWLLEAGDTVQAARLLTWFESFIGPFEDKLALAGPAYLALARIEDARGNADAARRAYRLFLMRYDLPDPAHRGLVEEARAALARLEGRGSGPHEQR